MVSLAVLLVSWDLISGQNLDYSLFGACGPWMFPFMGVDVC